MNPTTTLSERLNSARDVLAGKEAGRAAKQRAADEAERTEAAEAARIEAQRLAEARAEDEAMDAARVAVAQLEAEIERQRIAKIRADAEATEAVKTLWARADDDAARLAAEPHGPRNLQVRAELALRRSTSLVCPAELWQVDSPDLASVTLADLAFRVMKRTSDVAPGVGAMDIVTLRTPGGWVGVLNVSDLHDAAAGYPALRSTTTTEGATD